MKTVGMMGQFRQYLLVCLVRVVACMHNLQISDFLSEVVMVRKSVSRQGEGSVGLLAIMAMGEVKGDLGDVIERWRVRHGEEVDIENLLGGVWLSNYD